ncbi:MAG: tRNA (adenosine(37)-N6)-threonylcarbamoyltransferase complex dimerization subunit type 1 TsaB, partial [Chloroflexi bacterium]|nr:tRNA (adenosine(37)-N6)-threonylcarbamoyltransferase complex dimerization subunit type 1 TsaB [Chloroflexota bacterium]
MLLAIDTATALAGIALMDTSGVPKGIELRGSTEWHTERNHTVELLPNVVRLMSECSVSASELQAIAVAIGPGSYTGLRIGLSVAKGFCFANGAALIGVPTLDISAHAYP